MLSLIISELQRIFSRTKTKVALILTIILALGDCFFIKIGNIGFYSSNISMELNSLNFPVFILKDLNLFFLILIFPLLFVDSLSHEYTTGSLRLILIRPFRRHEFIMAKLISLAITLFIFIAPVFIISVLYAQLFYAHAAGTYFFNIGKSFNVVSAIIYTIKYYLLNYIVMLFILSTVSLICSLIPSSILSIIASLLLWLGLLYVSRDLFYYIFESSKYVFDALSGTAPLFSTISLLTLGIFSICTNIIVWHKKDWLD